MDLLAFDKADFLKLDNKELLHQLISQINNDIALIGGEYQLKQDLDPANLITELSNYIDHLLKNDFTKLLNLLYRIDVPESQFKNKNEMISIDHIVLQILKKEMFKIYFRNRN